jgi:hypothetical protein
VPALTIVCTSEVVSARLKYSTSSINPVNRRCAVPPPKAFPINTSRVLPAGTTWPLPPVENTNRLSCKFPSR